MILWTVLAGIAAAYLLFGAVMGLSRVRMHGAMYQSWRSVAFTTAAFALLWLPLVILWAIQHRGRPP